MIWTCIILGFVFSGLLAIIAWQFVTIMASKRIAYNRLQLLRRVIEYMYLYKDRPIVFLHKTQEELQYKKLLKSNIIPMRSHSKMTESTTMELFMCRLIDAGFSRKEVCAIFDLKNVNCLYVKFHRAKKKLQKSGIVAKSDQE